MAAGAIRARRGFSDGELTACLPAVRRFAQSLTRCSHAADDLTQDTALRSLRFRDRFRGGNLVAWLCTICRRLFYNRGRGVAARAVMVDVADCMADSLTVAAPQDEHVEMQRLERCFRRLQADEQALLLRAGIDGASYAELAAAMGVPLGTLRSRLSRLRAKLRADIETVDPQCLRQASVSAAMPT